MFQFNLEKTTEPVQPRAILKFPHIYGPKPVVTSSEIVNYSDYNLKTTDVQAKGKPAVLDEKRRNIQVNEELFILPQNGRYVVKPYTVATCSSTDQFQHKCDQLLR